MYAQYSLTDPNPTYAFIGGTTAQSVEADTLLSAGVGQLQIPDGTDTTQYAIDTTQNPPVLVAAPSNGS